jgi:uncharacterized protein (TIGR02246 family)
MTSPHSRAEGRVTINSVKAIHELSKGWIEAVKAKDLDRLLTLVTDDVIFLPSSGPPIKGKDAVGGLYRALFTQFDIDQTADNEEIVLTGEWAFSWGAETLTLSPLQGGSPVRLHGKGLAILRRQQDGSWKFARGINNSVPQ